jgi:gluconolactonase
MYFDQPPRIVPAGLFTTMPDEFRRKGVASAWADANKRGVPVDSFIEGPAFDAAGNLHIVDIPFGRVFRISPQGQWTCLIEYDGEPNGLRSTVTAGSCWPTTATACWCWTPMPAA